MNRFAICSQLLLFFLYWMGAEMTVAESNESMPAPFTRVFYITTPLMKGKDVVILQNLLPRSYNVTSEVLPTGFYDKQTAVAVGEYKKANLILSEPLVFDDVTAALVLKQLSYDGYKDDGKIPHGYKFKIFVPVHKDRNIETEGILMDSNGQVRHRFRVRAHGSLDSSGNAVNQFTHNGNTPTGLVQKNLGLEGNNHQHLVSDFWMVMAKGDRREACDLNSKEPNPVAFGPYPVVRAVKGLEGNVAIGKNKNDTFLSNYRSGILIHTGEWKNWNASMDMPNSNGCLHVHPDDMKKIDDILKLDLNVTVNKNPYGKLPYPYPCQGIMSIQQIDEFLEF